MRADHDPSPSPSADEDLVAVPRATLAALVEQVTDLSARMRAVEDAHPPPSRQGEGSEPEPRREQGAIGRRRALAGLAGAAAAGAAVVAGAAQPAAADNGDALVLGSVDNTATAATGLTVQGTAAAGGLAVSDNSVQDPGDIWGRAAVFGHARTQSFGVGVLALGESGSDAIVGQTTGGGGIGVIGRSENDIGGSFRSSGDGVPSIYADHLEPGGIAVAAGAAVQLQMVPTNQAAPTAGAVGYLRWSSLDKTLWACIAAGTPGTWRKIVGTGTAGAFHLLPAPVRIYDSRAGTTPSQGPKAPLPAGNVARTIDCKHNGSGVPNGATGVVLTVLLANAATGNGNLTVWANDKAKPQSNTMVWGGNAGRFTATALSALDGQARIKIDASLQTNVILDVVGYYR